MTEAGTGMTATQSLWSFLADHYPAFLSGDDAKVRIEAIDPAKVATLLKVLKSEESGKPSFIQREADFSDFYGFDLALNALFSDILSSKVPFDSLTAFQESELFARDQATEAQEQAELQELGYRISSHRFTPGQLDTINKEIADATFVSRGVF